jgi:hypothetical protein
LYNALNGTNYTNADDLTITTLEDIVYINMKNDVSFLLKEEMNLMEHQSTWNPNLPLRGLIYFGKLYAKFAKQIDADIYGRVAISLPTPKYVVLYNGKEDHGEETELRLSDLYSKDGDVEVAARVIDINYEKGKAIFENCRILEEYAYFVDAVRRKIDGRGIDGQRIDEGHELNEAVELAIDECIKNGILKDILIAHKAEVHEMIFTEFDQEQYDKHRRNEGEIRGIKIGESRGRIQEREKNILGLLKNGVEKEVIAKGIGITIEEIDKIEKKAASD